MKNILVTGDGALGIAICDAFPGVNRIWMIGNDDMALGTDHIIKLIGDIITIHGKFDIIINNYGYNHLSWIGETDQKDFDRIFHANVMMPYFIVDHIKKSQTEPCRVVNVASQTYRVPQRCTSLYCASKAALVMMTKVMARELGPTGWIINAIAPGKIVETEMSQLTDAQVCELRGWHPEDADHYAIGNIPMGRFTTANEVAEAIVGLLAMPDYVNGTCLDMTGAA